MDWARQGKDWPLHEASRMVSCRPHLWHLQEMGQGPSVLLLHGTGASTHSWRGVTRRLAGEHHVVALDLPGHGFTRMGRRVRSSLANMHEDLVALSDQEGWRFDAIIGHSAGGALALSLARDLRPRLVIGLNAALDEFDGVAGWLFPALARLMSINPLVPTLVNQLARSDRRIRTLLASTGSQLDEPSIALYRSLLGDRAHVDGALAMMAQWRLTELLRHLPEIDCPVALLAGSRDKTVVPAVSRRAAEILPKATFRLLPGLGHLAQEEDPAGVSAIFLEILRGNSGST